MIRTWLHSYFFFLSLRLRAILWYDRKPDFQICRARIKAMKQTKTQTGGTRRKLLATFIYHQASIASQKAGHI